MRSRPVAMINRLLLLSLFGLSVHSSHLAASTDAELVPAIRQRLLQPDVLRGEFAQRKQVAGFSKPLQSSGTFLVARQHGVLWLTQRPFSSALRLTRDQILATQGGVETFRLDAAQQPAVSAINSLLFSLLNGDISALTEHFIVTGNMVGTSWQLELTPRQPVLARIMRQVHLQGGAHVQQIAISESNGDHTEIAFSRQTSDTPLSAAEVASFE